MTSANVQQLFLKITRVLYKNEQNEKNKNSKINIATLVLPKIEKYAIENPIKMHIYFAKYVDTGFRLARTK